MPTAYSNLSKTRHYSITEQTIHTCLATIEQVGLVKKATLTPNPAGPARQYYTLVSVENAQTLLQSYIRELEVMLQFIN